MALKTSPGIVWHDIILNDETYSGFPEEMREDAKVFYKKQGIQIESKLSLEGLLIILDIHKTIAKRSLEESGIKQINQQELERFEEAVEGDNLKDFHPLDELGRIPFPSLQIAGLKMIKKYAIEGKGGAAGQLLTSLPEVLEAILLKDPISRFNYAENILKIFSDDIVVQATPISVPLFMSVYHLSPLMDSELLRKFYVQLARIYNSANESKPKEEKELKWKEDYLSAARTFSLLIPSIVPNLSKQEDPIHRYHILKSGLDMMQKDPSAFYEMIMRNCGQTTVDSAAIIKEIKSNSPYFIAEAAKKLRVIIFGRPGSGKGTHAKKVADEFGLFYFSTGEYFRRISEEDTEFARYVKDLCEKHGGLVPDKETTEIVFQVLQGEKNCFLDGYPRTIPQAESLEDFLKPDIAILLDVPDSVSLERQVNRRICKKCERVYSTIYPPFMPAVEGICSIDGSNLVARKDGERSVAQNRLSEYNNKTALLKGFYENLGRLVVIDGTQSHELVRSQIISAIKDKAKMNIN